MLPRLLNLAAQAFDAIERRWEGAAGQRFLGTTLAGTFVAGLLVIEANRRGWLSEGLSQALPTNHFATLGAVFTLLLAAEVVGLVLALPRSVAASLGKQFEVFALILLRKAFVEYARFGEPLNWPDVSRSLPFVLADLGGALGVFALLAVYYRCQRHRAITADARDQAGFIREKKAVALLLLASFAVMSIETVVGLVAGHADAEFFARFYTLLVFSDILIVLVSLRYSSRFAVVFRNSGFAAATTVARLALSAPPGMNALLGVGALAFAVGLTMAYNRFQPVDETATGRDERTR